LKVVFGSMVRSSLILTVAVISCGSLDLPSVQPEVDALAVRLNSSNSETRLGALRTLDERGASSARAVSAVIAMMSRLGWNVTELSLACGILSKNPRSALESLPLLTEWMVASDGDQRVFVCYEDAARAAGVVAFPKALAATAEVARQWLPRMGDNHDAMFDTMAAARRALTRPLRALRPEALPVLEATLSSEDEFHRAEAAGFLALMGVDARSSERVLREALKQERSSWAAHEMQAALRAIEQF
jgi:hypothetical protein